MKRFQDRVTLVTGAASGIGRGVAERAAAEGALLYALDVQTDDLARRLCYRCKVIGPCRDLGEALAPHRHGSLYGARYWAPR